MGLGTDKFYEEDRREKSASGPLNFRTAGMAAGLHIVAFLFFWVAAKISYSEPEVVIPIDMTVVPPWAEQDPDDPEPDPNPPPEEEEEKPETKPPEPKPPEPEPEPIKQPEEKIDAVEKVEEKPEKKKKPINRGEIKQPDKKPKNEKKVFKRGEIKQPDKKPKQEGRKKITRGEIINPKIKPPVKLPPGKGTSRDKPLSMAEIEKAIAAGARYGASNQLAQNEEERCVSLIKRKFYESWTNFNWSEGLKPVVIVVRFGNGGKILKYWIRQSSGDKAVDESVRAAAKRAGRVNGLSADFLREYPEIPIVMTPRGE